MAQPPPPPQRLSSNAWGSAEEVERRNRIRLTCWAYAYEVEADPLATDQEYDALAKQINVDQLTGNPVLDMFFKLYYMDYTGSWVYMHPEFDKLKAYVKRVRSYKNVR